jgi:hypothetical protein
MPAVALSGVLPALDGSALTGVNAATFGGQSTAFYQNASNLTTGTLADARLSTNIPRLNAANQTFTGNVSAGAFTGSGAALTSVNAASLGGVSASGYLRVNGSNAMAGMLDMNGNVIANAGSISSANVIAGSPTLSGSISIYDTNGDPGFLQPVNLTAPRVWDLPNKSGTLATLSDIPTGSAVPSGAIVYSDSPVDAALLGAGYSRVPALNSLATTDLVEGAPDGRSSSVSVWTGSEMLIWGGQTDIAPTNTGARFNPATGTWTSMSLVGAPTARF